MAERKLRAKNSRFPFTAFPNGWFRIADSNEVKPGEVKPLHYFGKELVLFRTEKGIPYVFDAYCSHLGAHLGYGGKVKGESIQCPFHEWCYDSNGKCIATPHTNRQPPNTKVQKWLTRENNGVIMVYHHSEGEPPTWEIPDLSEYAQGMSFRKVKQWKVRTHAQEIGENGCDLSHIMIVHDLASMAFPPRSEGVEFDGVVVTHHMSSGFIPPSNATWLLGDIMHGKFVLKNYGLGCQFASMSLKGKLNFQLVSITWITPINEEYCNVCFMFAIPSFFKNPLAYATCMASSKDGASQIERDFSILENKVYRGTELLYSEDGPIGEFRQWARQFYCDFSFAKQPLSLEV